MITIIIVIIMMIGNSSNKLEGNCIKNTFKINKNHTVKEIQKTYHENGLLIYTYRYSWMVELQQATEAECHKVICPKRSVP